MAYSLNEVNIIGNVGRDPESNVLPSGAEVANFSVACSERWKDKTTGEDKERTEWIRCTAWGKLAEIVTQYVRKGDKIFCKGKYRTREWEDKAGNKRYSTEVHLSEVVLLGKRGGKPGQEEGDPGPSEEPESPRASRATAPVEGQEKPEGFDDDIPF